jgi:TMEM189-like protein
MTDPAIGQAQTYAVARYSRAAGHALWLAMLDDVKRQRLLAPSLAARLPRLALLIVTLGAALWWAWLGGSWLGVGGAHAATALLLAQFAFVGHDAGHGSISGKPAVNRALGHLCMTLVTGLAFDEWMARHRAHHKFCQDEHRDPDMAVDVVVSLTENSRRRKGTIGFIETNGASCLACLPVLAAACLMPLESTPSMLLQALLLFICLGALATNQCHKWAHMDASDTPHWVRWAQRRGLVLPREHHRLHHTAPFDTHFCMSSGWLNAPLNALLRAWR